MKDIRNMNIWKPEPAPKGNREAILDVDIAELLLSVRSYNGLKRAGCSTLRDVYNYMGEDGQGLKRIRNLGTKSEAEILGKIHEFEETFAITHPAAATSKRTLIKPAKDIWNTSIDQFHISNHAMQRLSACGIRQVRDLYATNPKNEPGWYAVRELFEKIGRG